MNTNNTTPVVETVVETPVVVETAAPAAPAVVTVAPKAKKEYAKVPDTHTASFDFNALRSRITTSIVSVFKFSNGTAWNSFIKGKSDRMSDASMKTAMERAGYVWLNVAVKKDDLDLINSIEKSNADSIEAIDSVMVEHEQEKKEKAAKKAKEAEEKAAKKAKEAEEKAAKKA